MAQALQKAVREFEAKNLPKALAMATQSLGRNRAEDPGLQALIGKIQFQLGRHREAADAFVQVAEHGANAAHMLKLAVSLYRAAGADAEVLRIGLSAVDLNPADADMAFSVAQVFFARGLLDEMLPLIPRLDKRRPAHMALIVNHYRFSGRDQALPGLLREALNQDPGNGFLQATAHMIAREHCDFATMEKHADLVADPGQPLVAAMREHEAVLSRLTWSDDEAINALPSPESAAAEATRPAPGTPRRAIGPADRKLRIGYLSNDFFQHATMTLLRDALECHDREKYDVTLFCHTPANSLHFQAAWPETLRNSIVRVEGLSDAEAAARIDDAGIDILVDLKGHTMGARLGIVNLSRAPIKATYIGFPGSVTGVDLDYAITDRIVTPDTSKPFYAEKLCRLPDSYQANSCNSRPLPAPASRADHGLPQDALVIASFNATHKINPRTLDTWLRVLKAVPQAIFWCMCPKAHAAENLLAELERRGIGRDRVVIAGMCVYHEHISRVALADLALDTWPYNGHTTTSDMLWAGLPVAAVTGNSFASRVSASLLHAAGLSDLVVDSHDAYVDLVVALAVDRDRREAIRRRIEAARFSAPLFDAERFARHLETAYDMMAARARAGLASDHIDVPALPPRQGGSQSGQT